MARKPRDYAAEYARRQARARNEGWQSYWHKRTVEREAEFFDGSSRRKFVATAKDPPEGITPAEVRRLWADADQLMQEGDREGAAAIAEQLGITPAKPGYPPESAFWYH